MKKPVQSIVRWLAFSLIALFSMHSISPAQSTSRDSAWQLQDSGVQASLRGLCVVNHQIVWASGSGGTVIRTDNGGTTWQDVSLRGRERSD